MHQYTSDTPPHLVAFYDHAGDTEVHILDLTPRALTGVPVLRLLLILELCLFQFVYGIPRVVDQGVRPQLIRHYCNIGYKYSESIIFLLCIHRIAVSLPQLKRILRRMGLRKKKRQTSNRNRQDNFSD